MQSETVNQSRYHEYGGLLLLAVLALVAAVAELAAVVLVIGVGLALAGVTILDRRNAGAELPAGHRWVPAAVAAVCLGAGVAGALLDPLIAQVALGGVAGVAVLRWALSRTTGAMAA